MTEQTMIDRVARGMWEKHAAEVRPIYESGWTGTTTYWEFETQPLETIARFQSQARAAIEAMKQPTEAMVDVGMSDKFDIYWGYNADGRPWTAEAVFGAMIDAALGVEKP